METVYWDDEHCRVLLVNTEMLLEGDYWTVNDGTLTKYIHYFYLAGDVSRWEYLGEL